MTKAIFNTLRALTLCLLLNLTLSAQAAGEPLPMWEIRSTASKGAVYLLGSVHVCRESCLQFPESVRRRFRDSQALALELDPNRPELASQMLAAMTLPAGETLSSKLSTKENLRLKTTLDGLGFPVEMVNTMRPVMVATLLSILVAQRHGLSPEHGVDNHFQQQAQAQNKPIRELETVERQLAALGAGSEAEQITTLIETLDMMDKGRTGPYLDELIKAWQSGNLQKLSQLMREGMGKSSALTDALFAQRNTEMANKISLWLSRGEQVFVVIGAGHIAGDGNVAQLLERKGFSVRQVNNGE